MAVLFRAGEPLMADYTPGADVKGGDVVVVGTQARIAHVDIASGVRGAVAIGYGIYLVPKTAGGSTAIGDGVKVYWDATNKVATTTVGSNKALGTTVAASVDADTAVLVAHFPN